MIPIRQRYPHHSRVGRGKEPVLPERLSYRFAGRADLYVGSCKNDIAKTIRYAAQKTNTAILLVTHDITLAESICDIIAVMRDGKIIEQGEIAL